jgi:hypothetical protein
MTVTGSNVLMATQWQDFQIIVDAAGGSSCGASFAKGAIRYV